MCVSSFLILQCLFFRSFLRFLLTQFLLFPLLATVLSSFISAVSVKWVSGQRDSFTAPLSFQVSSVTKKPRLPWFTRSAKVWRSRWTFWKETQVQSNRRRSCSLNSFSPFFSEIDVVLHSFQPPVAASLADSFSLPVQSTSEIESVTDNTPDALLCAVCNLPRAVHVVDEVLFVAVNL